MINTVIVFVFLTMSLIQFLSSFFNNDNKKTFLSSLFNNDNNKAFLSSLFDSDTK